MHSLSEIYEMAAGRRKGQTKDGEMTWRCLCCYDTGLITQANVRKYMKPLMESRPGMLSDRLADLVLENDLGPSAPPMQCTRSACNAGMVEVPVQIKTEDGEEEQTRLMPRYNWSYVECSADPKMCQWIHESEQAAMRGEA